MRPLLFRPISDKALAYFYTQMATMEEGGITSAAALATVEEQFKSAEFRGALKQLRSGAESGRTLSGQMEEHPRIFTPLQCSLVQAGETGGTLAESYRRLASHLERNGRIRDQIVLALIYPAIILHVGVLLLALVDFIQVGLVSALLSIVITLGVLYAGGLGLLVLHRRLGRSPGWEQMLTRIPWVGQVRSKLSMVYFTRTLGALLEAGVNVTLALEQAGDASGSPVIRKIGLQAAELVEGGRGLADAFVGALVFPPIILQMLDVGEKSGRLPETLLKTSEVLEDEANHSIRIMVRILPIAASLIIFGFLGVKIVLFWLGIYGSI